MPLTFDMPLEQLKTYQGINPRPNDFDSFWDQALVEMQAADYQVTITPNELNIPYANCYDMYFTGVQGARIYCQLLQPKNNTSPHPAILMFHGYGYNTGDWYHKLAYVAAGYTVAAMDCRGQGGRSQDIGGNIGTTFHGHLIRGLDDTPEKLFYRQIFLDTASLARIIMDMDDVDENRVGVVGFSQGGALTLACASLEPRIKKAAPIMPFLSDYKRIWQIDLAKNAYLGLHEYFRFFDPRHEREDEVFTKLGYIDLQHLVPRIQGEVLLTTCLMDQICPPSTQFAAYNKITSPKEMLVYPDYEHEIPPGAFDKIFAFMMNL